jgi:hypothetical protein
MICREEKFPSLPAGAAPDVWTVALAKANIQETARGHAMSDRGRAARSRGLGDQ